MSSRHYGVHCSFPTSLHHRFSNGSESISRGKLQLSQAAISLAGNAGVDVVVRQLWAAQMPNFNGTTDVTLLGLITLAEVNWMVSNIDVTNVTSPTSFVGLDSGFNWTMTDAGITVTGNVSYVDTVLGLLSYGDASQFTLTTSGVSANISLSLYADSNGRPGTSIENCSCTIDQVAIAFSGGLLTVYNLFSGSVEDKLQAELQVAVCASATDAINNSGNQQLSTINVNVPLNNGDLVDCRMTSNPSIGTDSLHFIA